MIVPSCETKKLLRFIFAIALTKLHLLRIIWHAYYIPINFLSSEYSIFSYSQRPGTSLSFKSTAGTHSDRAALSRDAELQL